jgi:hypothetical protein
LLKGRHIISRITDSIGIIGLLGVAIITKSPGEYEKERGDKQIFLAFRDQFNTKYIDRYPDNWRVHLTSADIRLCHKTSPVAMYSL